MAGGLSTLARFNVMLDDPNRPQWKRDYFVGVPAPAGALTALLPLYLHFLGLTVGAGFASVILVYVVVLALLVISTVPTFSGKTMGKRVPRSWVLPIFVVTVAGFGLVLSFPFEALAALSVAYIVLLPVGAAQYRRRARRESAREGAAREGGAGEATRGAPG